MADEDIEGMAIRIAMDDSNFQQGVQNLKRNLSVIDSGFKESIAGLKDWGKNIDALKNNTTALGEKIETQEKIVKSYQEQLDKTKKSLQENSQKMLDLREKVESAKSAWEESKQELGANAEATQKLKKDYDELNAEYEKSESTVLRNSKSVDGYTIQLDKQGAKLKELQAALAENEKQILEQNSTWLNASKTLEDSSKKLKTLGEGFSNVGESMSMHFTLPIVAALGLAVKSGADFTHQMADIRKELVATGEPIGEVDSTMKEMSSDSLQWGADFGQSTTDINQGLLTMKKDGYSGKEAIDDLKTSLYTARGANEDLSDVVNTLGGSLEAYGMKTNNAAENTKNMSHIADSFAYTANHTKASVTSLGEGFSIAGQTLSAMNQPIEDTEAAIGELASSNIDASTAADALKAGFVNLTKPTAKMSAAMKEVKLNVFDTKGQMKDLPTILDEINDHTKNWTEQQRNAAIATIFGKESLGPWNALLNKGGDNLRTLADGAKNSTGEVQRLSDSMKNTPVNKLKELEGSVKALGVTIGEDVLPTFMPLVQDATNAVKAFANLDDGTKGLIVRGAEIVAIAGPVLAVTGKTIEGISKIESGLSKLSGWIGKKLVENGIKSNTKAQDANTKSVATNTETLSGNTKAEGENAAATEVNTKAKGANSKANGEYKNTLDDLESTVDSSTKKTGTAAETIEDLGKKTEGASSKVGKTAEVADELGKTVEETAGKAGVAATAVEGLGSTAGGAEAGLGAAGGGAAALGTTMAGLVAPIAIGVGAIASIGYIGYDIHKTLTQSVVPSVDLFKDKVEKTGTSFVNVNGLLIPVAQETTTKISEATKKAVDSYEKLNDSVTKTQEDIYINSDKFTQQTKNTVIKNFSDMVNTSTSLDNEMKSNKIKDFTDLVSNTNNLTASNRQQIVYQYELMLSQTTGISDQQKQKLIKNFQDTLTNSVGITKNEVSQIKSQYDQMTSLVNNAIDARSSHETKTLQDLFSKSTSISQKEQQTILNNITTYGNVRKKYTSTMEDQILQIYQKAVSQHRGLTTQEQQQVNKIQSDMQQNGIKTLSKSEIDSKIILQRIKDYNGSITTQQASDTIKNAEKARQGAVSSANAQYNSFLSTIIQERDGTHEITSKQADDMIKEAKRQRDESINKANDMKKGVVKKVEKMNHDVADNVNTTTGNIMTQWDKVKKYWDNLNFGQKTMKVVTSIGKAVNGDLWGGIANLLGYAGGTDNASEGWHWVGEEGPELMWCDGGEKVIPHDDSSKIVQQTLQTSGSAPALTADTDKLKTTEQYGENLNTSFGKGLTDSIDYATNPLNNMTTQLNSIMDNASDKYIDYGKQNIKNLETGITDKSQDVANAQKNITDNLDNNLNTFATNATAHGTKTDTSIQSGLQGNAEAIYNELNSITSNAGNILRNFANGCNTYGTEIVNSISAGVQSAEGNLTSVVKDLTDKVIQAFQSGFDIHSPSRKTFWLGTMLPAGLMNGIKSVDLNNFINKWLSSITGGMKTVGGNIAGILSAALAIDGEPLTWLPALEMITSRESGTPGVLGTGDASLVNSVGVGGEFATGLMQMLPSTFASYAKSGMNSITNGLDNAVAAIRYIADRYKTPFAIPNWNNSNYGGYEQGTDNASEGWYLTGEKGPEWIHFNGGETVLNNQNTSGIMDSFKSLLNTIKSTKISIPDVSGAHYNTTNNNVTNNYTTAGNNGGGVNINFDHVTINGYNDIKRVVRDAYHINQDYQKGKGAY